MRYFVFFTLSILLHFLLLLFSPDSKRIEDSPTVVEFQPVSRVDDLSNTNIAARQPPANQKPKTEEAKPAAEPEATKPIPEPEPAQESSTGSESAGAEPTAETAEAAEPITEAGDEVFPENELQARPEGAEDVEGVLLGQETVEPSGGNTADSVNSDVAEAAEPEPEPEPRDGRVEVPVIQTFVSDRIRGQIEFKGKGRELFRTPQSPDFRLTNNTSVYLNFKIDTAGIPYDIEIPPVPLEVERALTDFVLGMRFTAVLYDEPDSAGMRVDLQVR